MCIHRLEFIAQAVFAPLLYQGPDPVLSGHQRQTRVHVTNVFCCYLKLLKLGQGSILGDYAYFRRSDVCNAVAAAKLHAPLELGVQNVQRLGDALLAVQLAFRNTTINTCLSLRQVGDEKSERHSQRVPRSRAGRSTHTWPRARGP